MLSKLKILVDVKDNSQDALLSLLLDMTEQKVKNYCNRDDIPAGLEPVIIEMVANQYHARSISAAGGNVESIKRGDTEIKYASSDQSAEDVNIINDYSAQLARFKKLKVI